MYEKLLPTKYIPYNISIAKTKQLKLFLLPLLESQFTILCPLLTLTEEVLHGKIFGSRSWYTDRARPDLTQLMSIL